MPAGTYRLKLAITAIAEEHQTIVQIPAGSTVRIDNTSADSGLFVNVFWETRTMAVFKTDLEDRGVLIKAAGSGAA